MANYSALTFQDAWHHEICTLDHTSVCYVSLSKYLHMMPFWRQPDHYISRFYGDSTLQKLDAVTPDGDTAHHKKTIESEKLRASQNHNDTSKGCKLVAQPRPLLFSRHALCSRRSQRTGTDVCHYNSHIEKTWSRFKKKRTKNLQNMLKQVLDVFGLHTLKQCLNIRARQRNQATPRRPSFLATFLPNFLPNFLNLKLHFVALLSPLLTSVLQDPPWCIL